MSTIFDEIHRIPSLDTPLVAGIWHRHRISPFGFLMEARIRAKALICTPNRGVKKFLVIGRARSGTTLLTRMLNDHSQIHCAGEELRLNVLDPVGLARCLAEKSAAPVFGFKLLSYQMVQVHRMKNPQRFLRQMAGEGFRFVHLHRATLSQCLSLTVALGSDRFHSNQTRPSRKPHELAPIERAKHDEQGRLLLDPANFLGRVRWAMGLLEYEKAALEGLDPLVLSYESDLMTPEQQAATAKRLFDWLGVPDEPVAAGLKKLLPTAPDKIVGNWCHVVSALRAEGLGSLLEEIESV